MDKFKKEITDILVNHDKERTLLTRRFNMFVARNSTVKRTYSVFAMGFVSALSLMWIIKEIR